jgi:hypothetical protein
MASSIAMASGEPMSGAWKSRFDKRPGFAFIETVHGGIGIVNRHPQAAEDGRRRRFAHADRAGEAENEGHALLTIKMSCYQAPKDSSLRFLESDFTRTS